MTGISSLYPCTPPLLPVVPQAMAAAQEKPERVSDAGKPSPHGRLNNYGVIVCSDVNRDGKDEIIHQNLEQGVVVSTPHESPYGSGYEAFPEVQAIPDGMADPSWKLVGSGFFGDNPWEAMFFQHQSSGKLRSNWINSELFNQGELFSLPAGFPHKKFEVIGIADYNRDSHSDILIRDRKSGEISVWLLNDGTPKGSRGADAIVSFDPDSGINTEWKVIGIGSFHHGGTHDMVSRNPEGVVKVSIYENTHRIGETILHEPESSGSGDPIVGTGDIDGDGATDLLRKDSMGKLYASFMNGIYEQRCEPLFYLRYAGREGGNDRKREEEQ